MAILVTGLRRAGVPVDKRLAELVRYDDDQQQEKVAVEIRERPPMLTVPAYRARFARELSDRMGAVTVALAQEGAVVRFRLYERGRMVDEYLSVPNYYGDLAKGDELALAANPTLVARLTGADREEVRRIARNAASPSALPPAGELYESIARLMSLEP